MLSAYMVLSFYNFHERSEFNSTLTSTLTSETSVIMNSTLACFTSHKQSCFLTCEKAFVTSEKSIYHQWEKRTRRVAVWWNSVYAQGKFQRLNPKSATNLPHLPQSATNLPHIYPPVYHNDNAFLWQIGRFFREKPMRTRARETFMRDLNYELFYDHGLNGLNGMNGLNGPM